MRPETRLVIQVVEKRLGRRRHIDDCLCRMNVGQLMSSVLARRWC